MASAGFGLFFSFQTNKNNNTITELKLLPRYIFNFKSKWEVSFTFGKNVSPVLRMCMRSKSPYGPTNVAKLQAP